MRNKPILMTALAAGVLAIAAGTVFAQTPVQQNRIAQQVVVNGLRVNAAYVLAAEGGIQSYSCPTPQQYTMPDGSSQGWACFDSATNVWLLSAVPPQQQAPAPVQQVVQPVYQPAYQPVYQPVYQPQVVYQYAPVSPAIIYREYPRVVYAAPVYPRAYYSPSTAIGVASINAAGRIAAAVIESSRFHDDHGSIRGNIRVVNNRGGRR